MLDIKEDETLDDLDGLGMKILQKKNGFRFAFDSVFIAYFLEPKRAKTILDIGTGSGIIPIQLSHMYPKKRIIGVEIQDEIADMARRSVKYNNLSDKIEIIHTDVKNLELDEKIDIIVTNPPYMKVEEGKVSENSIKATSRHEVKLNLEEMLREAKRILKVGGSLNIIYRTDRFYELITKFEKYSFYPKRVRFIHSKKGMESGLFMVEAYKGRRAALTIMDPLFIFDEKGEYTAEVASYY